MGLAEAGGLLEQLTVAARPVAVGSGQEARLLKFVAVSGGRVRAELAIETIWAGAGPSAGRHRLRTVLHRLRATAGDVLSATARRSPSTRRCGSTSRSFSPKPGTPTPWQPRTWPCDCARGAMARYRGELLPDDRYEDWAERPRQQAQSAMLDLLDLGAGEAAQRGDLDALRRAVERTIEFAAYDDVRYLRTASALLEQGRRGEELAVLHRARSTFAQIGLEQARSSSSNARSSPEALPPGRSARPAAAADPSSSSRNGADRGPGHTVRSASVGERRAARIAGSRPAIAPIANAAASPPAQARVGITVAQCLLWA